MIAASDQLGIGIYTPAEAAFYARVRTQTLTRWLFGDKQGESVVRAQSTSEEKVVHFLDFVQALGIRAIRTQYPKISLQKIRSAVTLASDKLGVDYPFALPHETFIYDDREIVLKIEGKLIQISGKASGNLMIGPIAERYSERLVFGDDGLACEFRAWGEKGGHSVVMNPKRRFGEPIVLSCGYTAQALWEANITEGGIQAAARAYGVTPEEVALACDFYDHLLSIAA